MQKSAIATSMMNMDQQPAPGTEPVNNRDIKFWDKIAKRYAKSAIADEASYQHKLKMTQQYFDPDMDVLEIGCGTGSTALIHAPYVRHIHATDLSSNMLDIAREKASAENVSNITFEQKAVSELNMPDQTFDAILGMSILHLLENKEAAISNAYKMLKPGGVFVSSTVCLGDKPLFFKPLLLVGRFLRLFPLVKMFTTHDLVYSIEQSGFDIDYQWSPGKGKAVFIVAKKPG